MSVAMEDSATNDQSSGRSTSRLLRYPLRSATRSKEDKPPLTDSTNSLSATKRGRLGSSVTKSVGVLDLSGKEKSAKPPRRLSVPSKSNASPAPKSLGNITPISEARSTRSGIYQGNTPISEFSKTSSRKKFSAISSASYWLSQIKLSESAAKHSISLGFFKLAFEAGCAPIQTTRIRDELKSYVHRHNLSEFGESIKELFDSYKISESYEPSDASRTGSEVPPESNQLSDDDVRSSSSSITDAEKLKPKSLENMNSDEIHQVKKSNTETTQKDESVKIKRSTSKNAPNSKAGSEVVKGLSVQKKPQKPIKQESAQDKKKQGKKSARGEVAGPLNSPPKNEAVQENKENMAGPQVENTTPEV